MAKTKKRKMRTDYSDLTTAEVARLPILQGPENDYGEYDYLVNDLPADEERVKTRMGYKCECEGCGKEFKTLYISTHYFYTMDGWDSISYRECKKCAKLDAISRIKRASAAVRKRIYYAFKYAIISRRIRGVGGAYWENFYSSQRRRQQPPDELDKDTIRRIKKLVKEAKRKGEKPYMTKQEYAKIVRFANQCQGGW